MSLDAQLLNGVDDCHRKNHKALKAVIGGGLGLAVFAVVAKFGVPQKNTDVVNPTPLSLSSRMTFVGNGCCRFDGSRAPVHHVGAVTEAECQKQCLQNEECVAADIARPHGDLYDCFNWLAKSDSYNAKPSGFHTECSTWDPTQKCYARQGNTMTFFGNGCCRGLGSKIHEGMQTEKGCEQLCLQDPNCFAADVAIPQGDLCDCYTWRGAKRPCPIVHPECNVHSHSEKCYRKSFSAAAAARLGDRIANLTIRVT